MAKSEIFTLGNDRLKTPGDMKNQKNKRSKLILIDANANHFQIYGKNVHVTEKGFRTRNNICNFSKCFSIFVITRDVTEKDINDDKNKIKQFLGNIGYKRKADTRSNRAKVFTK